MRKIIKSIYLKITTLNKNKSTSLFLTIFILSLLALFLAGCSTFRILGLNERDFKYFVGADPKHETAIGKTCITVDGYSYLERKIGNYKNGKYNAEIHSQIELKKDKHLTPEDVGYLISITHDIILREFPNLEEWQVNSLNTIFENTLIIVTQDEKTLRKFWPTYKPKDKRKPYLMGMMSLTRDVCFSVPQNIYYVISIRNDRFYKKDPSTVVHEIMHMVSYILYKHLDTDHEERLLWTELNPKTSLQTRVVEEFKRVPLLPH